MTITRNSKSKEKRKKERKRIIFILSFITLPILQWLVFYVYAHMSSFTMAFTNSAGVWSFDNFTRLYNDLTSEGGILQTAVKNTMLTFVIILASYPFQVLVSYFIYKKVPGAGIFRILFFLPGILFSVCVSMVFSRLIGVNGFIAQWVGESMNLGYVPELLADERFANTVVLLHMLWLRFPGDLIILGGTFARIPDDVLEAGRIDGTNWWKEFVYVVIPMVWPTVALQMVLMFCGIFGASGSVFLLTQGEYGTMTLSAWMYITLLNGSGAGYTSNVYNYLSAVGLVMTVIAIGISLIVRKYTDSKFADVEF